MLEDCSICGGLKMKEEPNVVSCLGINTCIIILDSNCYGLGNSVRSGLGWILLLHVPIWQQGVGRGLGWRVIASDRFCHIDPTCYSKYLYPSTTEPGFAKDHYKSVQFLPNTHTHRDCNLSSLLSKGCMHIHYT